MKSLLNTIVTVLVSSQTATALVSGRSSGFGGGQPIDGNGKGAAILGQWCCPTSNFILNTDQCHRGHEQGPGPPEPRQPGPAEHRQWRRTQPEMELLRLQDSPSKGRMGP